MANTWKPKPKYEEIKAFQLLYPDLDNLMCETLMRCPPDVLKEAIEATKGMPTYKPTQDELTIKSLTIENPTD